MGFAALNPSYALRLGKMRSRFRKGVDQDRIRRVYRRYRLAPPIFVDDICQVSGLTGPEPTHQIAERSAPRLRTAAHSTRNTCHNRTLLSWMSKKKNIASSDSPRNGCGRRIGRARLINREGVSWVGKQPR